MMLSDFLADDLDRGEIRLVGLVALPTGVWAIAETLAPTGEDDKFRAYPEQNYSNTVGLICNMAASRKQVLEAARENR